MKLNQALKQKNRLAGDVEKLKSLLAEQNVKPKDQPFDYEAGQVLADLEAKVAELVAVKAAIAVANAEIHDKIFRLAELKGLVAVLKGLDVRHGIFKEGGEGYGADAYDVEYVAQLQKVQVDERVDVLEQEINDLQDELDEFNAVKKIAVNGE